MGQELSGQYYARIKSSDELPDGTRIVQLDAVSADALQPLIDSPGRLSDYRGALNAGKAPAERLRDVAGVAIRVTLGPGDSWDRDAADTWFRLGVSGEGIAAAATIPALLEPRGGNALIAPMVALRGGVTEPERVDPQTVQALKAIYSIDHWETGTPEAVAEALAGLPPAEQVVMFDVGQAGTSALLDDTGTPFLYVDLGWPLFEDRANAPDPPKLCFWRRPPVILTHWHDDHTQGYTFQEESPKDPHRKDPLKSVWIVPEQEITANDFKLGEAIRVAGGRILVVKTDQPITVELGSGQRLIIRRSAGHDVNDSGLVLIVERDPVDGAPGTSWLFSGDCAYGNLRTIPERVSVLTAAHHGGYLNDKGDPIDPPPRPAGKGYARLLYSFGPHSSYFHPLKESTDAHQGKGWRHRKKKGSDEIDEIDWPGGLDVLSTSTAKADGVKRSAIAAGWTGKPDLPGHLRSKECMGKIEIRR